MMVPAICLGGPLHGQMSMVESTKAAIQIPSQRDNEAILIYEHRKFSPNPGLVCSVLCTDTWVAAGIDEVKAEIFYILVTLHWGVARKADELRTQSELRRNGRMN